MHTGSDVIGEVVLVKPRSVWSVSEIVRQKGLMHEMKEKTVLYECWSFLMQLNWCSLEFSRSFVWRSEKALSVWYKCCILTACWCMTASEKHFSSWSLGRPDDPDSWSDEFQLYINWNKLNIKCTESKRVFWLEVSLRFESTDFQK